MTSIEDFGQFETAWCPGCGNHQLLKAVKRSLAEQDIAPHQVLFVSGIGQAAKAPHYLNCNVFNGLHGRAIPAATGARLANPDMRIIVESGDGCTYGEGGNHFLAGIRRNINVTCLVHDNQVYGLTKGQASPTTGQGFETKAQPNGVFNEPFNPVATAVCMKAGFVARAFTGEEDQLVALVKQAMAFNGFALIDILQPCVSFNKVNTHGWYKKRCKPLPDDYDPTDWGSAMETACRWGDEIPTGVIYRNEEKRPLEEKLPALKGGSRIGRDVDRETLSRIMESFG